MDLIVYAVVFSNYEPTEVDSLWASMELAERRATKLGSGWEAVEWTVASDPDSELLK
jgi:hypothetical protein